MPLLVCLLLPSYGTAEPESVTVSLPKGQTMEFVLVRVSRETDASQNQNMFHATEFNMGNTPVTQESDDETVDYTQTQAPSSVSGTLYRNGCWVLPMAKTELTNAQYACIMTPDTMPTAEKANLPCTNLSAAQVAQFLEKLNTDAQVQESLNSKGLTNAQGTLFFRLPQENEWEFAARGATYVPDEIFNKAYPYATADELRLHEVLYVPGLNGVQQVGSKEPNPAGLCDMLGNVQELVEGSFCPEYHFGRVGGRVARGGSYLKRPEEVSCAARSELQLVERIQKGKETQMVPFTSQQVGCRLVLGSLIRKLGSRRVNELRTLNAAWLEHKLSQTTHAPGVGAGESIDVSLSRENEALKKSLNDLQGQLRDKLREQTADKEQWQSLNARLAEMQNRMDNMGKVLFKANEDAARGALYLIIYPCADAVQQERLLADYENKEEIDTRLLKLLDPRKDSARMRELKDELEDIRISINNIRGNYDTYWEQFDQGCRILALLPQDCVNRIIRERDELYLQKIQSCREPDRREGLCMQLAIFRACMKSYDYYRTNKKYNIPNRKAWIQSLYEVAASSDMHPVSLPATSSH